LYCIVLAISFTSCSKEKTKGQSDAVTYQHLSTDGNIQLPVRLSPDAELSCETPSCNGQSVSYSLVFRDFKFDLSTCISPDTISDCEVESWKGGFTGITAFGCLVDDVLEITVSDLDSFIILPDCLPEEYSVDLDCVEDQIIYQFTPSILEFFSNIFNLEYESSILTEYQKQLCAKYCTTWYPFPHVRIVPCEESYSCCRTTIAWERNEVGQWVSGVISTDVIGQCRGPEPKCTRNVRYDGPFSSSLDRSSCESRSCFQIFDF